MTRIIMHGCNGMMGQMITRIVKEEADAGIVAGIDLSDHIQNEYPVFSRLADCDVEADVLIDFASPKAMDGLLDYCVEKKLPAVLCTTGLSEKQCQRICAESRKIAILKSANMSLGINMLMQLVRDAARTLVPAGFDVEIVEKHHNLKKDAPSGTALALADAVNEEMGGQYEYVFDRSGRFEARGKKELGISAVRGGNIVGQHEVLFAGMDEVVEFRHTAYSKGVFAKGAVSAARFLKGKGPGLYDMKDVVQEVLGKA